MTTHTKALLYLKPTYELVVSKVLFSLGYGVAIIGIPLYLVQHGLHASGVGIFTGLISLLTVITSLYLPPILEEYNQQKLLIISSFVAGVSFILFFLSPAAPIAIVFLAVGQISLYINSNAFSVLFKDSTRGIEEFTKNTGLLGSLTNLGWFVGPLLGGLALKAFGFKGLFILAGVFVMLGGLYVLIFPFKATTKRRARFDTQILNNLKFFFSNTQLRIAYLQGLGIDFWWSFVWTFIPIFMLRRGYSGSSIGIYIALTQLPLFLFEFKTVVFVEKLGYKRIFTAAYMSLALMCFLSFFYFTSNLTIVLGLILLGSLALSFLEPISELFFFSKVSLTEEEKGCPIYTTSSPLGSMMSKILPGLILIVLPDSAVFVFIGLVTGFIGYRALAITD